MGCYKKVRTAAALKRHCLRFFRDIRIEEPQYRLEPSGISSKGKTLYDRVPLTRTDAQGREVPITVTRWLRQPTLEALCLSIPISMDTWERYAKTPEFEDVCAWAKNVCKTALIESGLNGEANPNLVEFLLTNAYGMEKKITVRGEGTVEKYLETHGGEATM